MNIIINNKLYNTDYLYIMEPVSNNVLENAIFYRLIYSNSYMTLNSLYFKVDIKNISIVKAFNKYKISFDNIIHKDTIYYLKYIESSILNKFSFEKKTAQYSILDAIKNDCVKLYSESNMLKEHYDNISIYLKISGFWMKSGCFGITYKFSY
jgi:hypothetical protein